MTSFFLEIPLTPVEGEKPATFPFHNMSGKPLSSPSYPSVEATATATLSPTWHPVSCSEEAEPLFPAHMSAGTEGNTGAGGPPQPEAEKGFILRRMCSQCRTSFFWCVASREAAASGKPLCQKSDRGLLPLVMGSRTPAVPGGASHRTGLPAAPAPLASPRTCFSSC